MSIAEMKKNRLKNRPLQVLFAILFVFSLMLVVRPMTVKAAEDDAPIILTFDANGGQMDASQSTKVINPGEGIGKLPVPKRTSYILDGWASKPFEYKKNGYDRIDPNPNLEYTWIDEDMDYEYLKNSNAPTQYYAVWKPDPNWEDPRTITLTFKHEIKGFKGYTMKIIPGEMYPSDWFCICRGRILTGWHVGSVKGKVVNISGKCKFTKNTTLYGTWKKANADQIATDIAKIAKKKKGDLNRIRMAARIVQTYSRTCSYEGYKPFKKRHPSYNKPEGVFVKGYYTCAGTTTSLGLVLTKMGYKWEHVNKGKEKHQWNVIKTKKGYIAADGMGGWASPGKSVDYKDQDFF